VERNAGQDGVMGLQDGCRDEWGRAVEVLGRRRLGVDPMNLVAWDASAAVRRDASADECQALQLLGADAEKLVDRELVCPEPDVLTSDGSADLAEDSWLAAALRRVLAAPDKPAVGQSAARSCAEQAAGDGSVALAQKDAELAR